MSPEGIPARALTLLLVWGLYFTVHSWTASDAFKAAVYRRWSGGRVWYRLTYNLISTVTVIPPLAMMLLWRTEPVLHWQGVWWYVANGAAVAALLMFYHSTRYYDMQHFLGTTALQAGRGGTREDAFCLSPYHRFVRHPWYFFGLLLLWTRSMDLMQLLSSAAISVYLVVGSMLEERKLVLEYGELYSRYQKKVPSLLPLPWKFLKPGEMP